MFLEEFTEKNQYTRTSKNGKKHVYFRNKSFIKLKCDCCGREFTRVKGSMDPKRRNNNYFHCCENCDAKRFAQKRGVERKRVWNLSASSDLPISKL